MARYKGQSQSNLVNSVFGSWHHNMPRLVCKVQIHDHLGFMNSFPTACTGPFFLVTTLDEQSDTVFTYQ